MGNSNGVGPRFPVRDAEPQAHDWTLNAHLRGLLGVHDTTAGPEDDDPSPDRDAVTGSDARDLMRMDSDLG